MRSHRRHLKRLRAAASIFAAFRPLFRLGGTSPPSIPSESGCKNNGTELQATSSRGGSDIVKTDENTTFDGARIGAAFVRGS